MEADKSVAYIYAESLYHVAQRAGKTEILVQQARQLIEVYQLCVRLKTFLAVPNIRTDEKKQVLERILKGRFDDLLLNLFFVLIERHRTLLLTQILGTFLDLEEKMRGIYHAEIRTAVPLKQEEKQNLLIALQNFTGYKFRVSHIVDPQVLGGVLVRFGDTVIDGTIWGKLTDMKSHLKSLYVF